MSRSEIRELTPPPDVREQGGVEVLRVFVVERSLSVALQRAFDDPGVWGMLLADVARQVARIYGRESEFDEAAALERIRAAIESGLEPGGDGDPRH